MKIGVVVNDVAEVNIDAKLVAASLEGGVVELQNGCACCSLADDLLQSIETLVTKRPLDAVVVELSGVADPMAVKSLWRVAPPHIRQLAELRRVVTLVDATSFGTDYMTWDTAQERPGWVDPMDDCGNARKVSELLAEQVESADLILVNKIDLASSEEVDIAQSVAQALNDKAEVRRVEFGRIDPMDLVYVPVLPMAEKDPPACSQPECTDPSHDHSHANHEHSHDHSHPDDGPTVTDAATGDVCHDSTCTDTSHSHQHHHHSHATSTDQLGITSFVYRSTMPFDARKLMAVLNQWPVPVKNTLDLKLLQDASKEGYEIAGRYVKDSPFVGVLRSKGFCWFAPSKWTGPTEDAWRHDTAMYWSHAGKHFSITAAGKWWGTISRNQMEKIFENNLDEYRRILMEDFVTEEFGDRRQEIVFIGSSLNNEQITATLDACLLTEKQMGVYRQKQQNYRATVVNTKSRGLFDVGGIDQLDLQ